MSADSCEYEVEFHYGFLLMASCGHIVSHTLQPLHSVGSISVLLFVCVIAGQPKFVVHAPQLVHLSVISLGGPRWFERRGQGRCDMMTHGPSYVMMLRMVFVVSLML